MLSNPMLPMFCAVVAATIISHYKLRQSMGLCTEFSCELSAQHELPNVYHFELNYYVEVDKNDKQIRVPFTMAPTHHRHSIKKMVNIAKMMVNFPVWSSYYGPFRKNTLCFGIRILHTTFTS